MACCALAAFVISQIVFALDALRERLGLAPACEALAATSAAWRLGDPPPAARVRPGPPRRRLAFALGVGLAVSSSAYALSLRSESPAVHAWHPSFLCTSTYQVPVD
jgi:hypothetical protein